MAVVPGVVILAGRLAMAIAAVIGTVAHVEVIVTATVPTAVRAIAIVDAMLIETIAAAVVRAGIATIGRPGGVHIVRETVE